MALDAAYKFTCIGLAAHGSNNTHMMMTLAALARPADVLVAVSHSGRSPEVVKTAEVVHSNGGGVIAVTSRQDSPLADEADCCAMYEAKEALLERGSISAKLGQAFIMDLIYTQIVKKMSSEATRCKKKTQDAVDLLR
jgi:DNA-binding MurR/RpiR family transcriptional regulator